jgi:phospho-N-acetylmuramoyl-pentapeptide-transferase
MLYYLSEFGDWAVAQGYTGDFFKALNVFSYITFRAICAGVTAFVLSLLFGNFVIRKLISLKFGQPIRTAAEVHKLFELHGAKKGTPTMGGILLIGSIVISTLLWAKPENPFVWLVLFSTVFLGAIGLYDDWLKVSKKNLFNQVMDVHGGDFDLSQHFVSLRELVQLTGAQEETETTG